MLSWSKNNHKYDPLAHVSLFFRSNRRYFEAFQLVPVMQELLRQHDSDNAFLSLNLRSVLVNLNVVQIV